MTASTISRLAVTSTLCILLIALEWIGFGSLHFFFPKATLAQIPEFVPWKPFIVTITGMIEVGTGVAILLPTPWTYRSRKCEAVTTLALLFLFLPAIYQLLSDELAITGFGVFQTFVKLMLVPNHVLLAYCSLRLWKESRHISVQVVAENVRLDPTMCCHGLVSGNTSQTIACPVRMFAESITNLPAAVVVATVMLGANCAGVGVILISFWYCSTAILWGMMCLALGAVVGFLFAVPKVNADSAKQMKYQPNSNIEVISDWLTKIIVGVGLIEFRQIVDRLLKTSRELGNALAIQTGAGYPESATLFATALIVYFLAAGLIQGYLLTRMYLAHQFKIAESVEAEAAKIAEQVKEATGARIAEQAQATTEAPAATGNSAT